LRMSTLSAEGAVLEGKLALNPHASEIAELGKKLKKVNDELSILEDQWLILSSDVEATTAHV